MSSIHTAATVGPDGTLDLHIANLPPGQQVTVTIEVPDPGREPNATSRHYTASELMRLPREERARILEAAAAEAAEEYATNPALSDFEAFAEDDHYDDHPPE